MTSTIFIKTVKKEMRIYKREKNIYNIIYFTEMGKTDMRLSKEQAGKIVENYLKHIKRTIKKKIAIYEPLDFETTYNGFIKWIQKEEFGIIREMPVDSRDDVFLEELIENFLIERAYYELAQKYLQRIIMNKLGNSNPYDVRVQDAVDYTRERLEKDGIKRLRNFKGGCKFKTFLTSAVYRLLIDLWRQQGTVADHVTKYGPEFDALFDLPGDNPLSRLIRLEDKELEKKAAELLPRELDKLEYKEKLAIKLKYEKGDYEDTIGKNDPWVGWASAVFERVKATADKPGGRFPRLYIINTKGEPFALSVPDGGIIINPTTLETCYADVDRAEGDRRLAFILGHELAHLANKDFMHQEAFQALQKYGKKMHGKN
jgi:RNA polymerase sigma factor (sigma-70 family)